jgi:hypothetical protein
LNLIDNNINKVIDQGISNKSITELQTEFNSKYKEILLFKDNPKSDTYHKLYNYLWDLHDKISNINVG